MKVFVNDKVIDVGDGADLIKVLKTVDVAPDQRGIAVAVNDRVVRRTDWVGHRLEAGDRVEVIQATQGG